MAVSSTETENQNSTENLPAQVGGQDQGMSLPEQNVNADERVMSVAAGAFVTLLGVTRGGLFGLILTGVGGAIAYRGLSGHCGVYSKLGINTADQK